MFYTHQDESAAQPKPSATPKAPHVTQRALASESTPAKQKYGSNLPYASGVKTFEEVRSHLGKEMNGRWLGAMPVVGFFDIFVPATEEPLPDLPNNPFGMVPTDGAESTRYDPFVISHEPTLCRRI
ncbi:hypothetical protein OG21DRAFT_1487695 [Imleria badia]|nr:hypothetical protein OG21DRAFT_1487695 [Imleria badia]